jgi:predicted SAM-dependent methyltransferase
MILRGTIRRWRQGMVPRGKNLPEYPVRVNLACGFDYREGWLNVDRYAPRADKRFDLFRPPWPMATGSIDYVLAEQILEHVPPRIGDEDGLIVILDELHRVLRPGGLLAVGVPYAGSGNDYQDITHYRHFVPSSFDFLDPARRPDHPLAAQSKVRFAVRRLLVRRSVRLTKYFDTGFHLPKYLGVDPNVGRKRAMHVLLERLPDPPGKR